MVTPTQDELQRYIEMTKDLQTYRGHGDQIKDIQAEMQSQDPAPSEARKERLQQQLADLQQEQRDFPAKMQKEYGVQSLSALKNEMRQMEPVIEQAYLQTQDLPDHLRTSRTQPLTQPQPAVIREAHTVMQEEQRLRQAASQGDSRLQNWRLYQETQQQAAQTQASQSTAQERIKQMTAFRDTYGHAKELQAAYQFSPEGHEFLEARKQAARQGYESTLRAYEARYGALPTNSIPLYQPLAEKLTPKEMQQLAREVDTNALNLKAQEVRQSRQSQGIEHPEMSPFMKQFTADIAPIHQRLEEQKAR